MKRLLRLVWAFSFVFMFLIASFSVAAADVVTDVVSAGYIQGGINFSAYWGPGISYNHNGDLVYSVRSFYFDRVAVSGSKVYFDVDTVDTLSQVGPAHLVVEVPETTNYPAGTWQGWEFPVANSLFFRAGDLCSITFKMSQDALDRRLWVRNGYDSYVDVIGQVGYTIFFTVSEDVPLESIVVEEERSRSVAGPFVYAIDTCSVASYGNASSNSNDSLIAAIENESQSIQDKIEDQYSVSEEQTDAIGGFGSEMASSVEDSLGPLDYASEISSQIVNLFASDPGDPVLTLPAFSLDVDGETYSVWNSHSFNLESLEESFGPLLTVVRFATVSLVYFAFVKYLHNVWTSIVHGKSLEEVSADDS